MECREHCAACCIATSIKQPIYGMPEGKKAGEYCANLDKETLRCQIWQTEHYPSFCRQFIPEITFCGSNQKEALNILSNIEILTLPNK